jgi:hypothetical protein
MPAATPAQPATSLAQSISGDTARQAPAGVVPHAVSVTWELRNDAAI